MTDPQPDPPVWAIEQGGCRKALDRCDMSVHGVVTSPPYFSQRDYGPDVRTVFSDNPSCDHRWREDRRGEHCLECSGWRGQLGREPQLDCESRDKGLCSRCYVCHLVACFRAIRSVLRDDGAIWLNLGDRWSSSSLTDLPQQNLLGTPWRVAQALQKDGWWVRSEVIWAKSVEGREPMGRRIVDAAEGHGVDRETAEAIAQDVGWDLGKCMPEPVASRPVASHETLFLVTPSRDYYFDMDAVRMPHRLEYVQSREPDSFEDTKSDQYARSDRSAAMSKRYHQEVQGNASGRSLRDVWQCPVSDTSYEHFATFSETLAEWCIKTITPEHVCSYCGQPFRREDREERIDDVQSNFRHRNTLPVASCECDGEQARANVLDPFCGSGTTLAVGVRLGRNGFGIEPSETYLEVARQRITQALQQERAPWEPDYPEGSASPPDPPTPEDIPFVAEDTPDS